MSYTTVKCARCGKSFLTGDNATHCRACQKRTANGKRLARDNAERRAEEREELLADMFWQLGADRLESTFSG